MKRTIRTIMMIIGIIVMSINSAWACMYSNVKSIEEEFKESDVVFVGEHLGCFIEDGKSFIKYDVHKIWNGEIKETYIRPLQIQNCFRDDPSRNDIFDYPKGRIFLVYSKYQDSNHNLEMPTGNLCDTNRSMEILSPWREFTQTIRVNLRTVIYSLKGKIDFPGFGYYKNYDLEELGKPIHTFEKSK